MKDDLTIETVLNAPAHNLNRGLVLGIGANHNDTMTNKTLVVKLSCLVLVI